MKPVQGVGRGPTLSMEIRLLEVTVKACEICENNTFKVEDLGSLPYEINEKQGKLSRGEKEE